MGKSETYHASAIGTSKMFEINIPINILLEIN